MKLFKITLAAMALVATIPAQAHNVCEHKMERPTVIIVQQDKNTVKAVHGTKRLRYSKQLRVKRYVDRANQVGPNTYLGRKYLRKAAKIAGGGA